MLVEFPDDLSTLIAKAQGPLNLKAFAEKAGISYSKLHRMAKHEIKRPVDAETLKAIAKHADPESGITLKELEKATEFVIEANKSYEDEQRELYNRRKNAASAIKDSIFNSRAISSMSRITHHHIEGLSNPEEDPYFDFSVKVRRDVPEGLIRKLKSEESLHFRVIDDPLGWNTVENLENFIGKIILRGQPRDDERYYLVVINDQKKRGNANKNERLKEFEKISKSLCDRCPGSIVVGHKTPEEVESEKKLHASLLQVSEDKIEVDDRIIKYIVNVSLIAISYEDESNHPFLTEYVIANEDRVLAIDDSIDIEYVFSDEYSEENVWVAPHVRVYHDVDKGKDE